METRAGISISIYCCTAVHRWIYVSNNWINRIKIKIVSHFELVMKEHISHLAMTKKHIAQNIFDLFHTIKKN